MHSTSHETNKKQQEATTSTPLCFAPVRLSDRAILDGQLRKYGGNSCQHSFAAMYSTCDKYGDCFAFEDDILYLHRSGLDDEESRCYLAPLGAGLLGVTSLGESTLGACDLKQSMERLLQDARHHGKRLRLETVTEEFANELKKQFPGRFAYEECRDLSEYLYTYEKLAELPGHKLASKRTDISRFWRTYGEEFELLPLTKEDIPEVLKYQKKWLAEYKHDEHIEYLRHEHLVIHRALAAFDELGCSGLVARYQGKLCGYVFGFPLSEDCYDVFIEKGDRAIKDIYRILNQEIVKRCCEGFSYINREEDLGVLGLRKAKESYEPDLLLTKYVVTEL